MCKTLHKWNYMNCSTTHFFHQALCSYDLYVSSYLTFLSCSMPLYEYTAIHSSSHLLIDICIISSPFCANNAVIILFIGISLYMYKHLLGYTPNLRMVGSNVSTAATYQVATASQSSCRCDSIALTALPKFSDFSFSSIQKLLCFQFPLAI